MFTAYLNAILRGWQIFQIALVISIMLASFELPVQAKGKERSMEYPTSYHTIQIDRFSIFYRVARSKDAPTLLLLRGLPCSSRWFEPLLTLTSVKDQLFPIDS